MTTVIEGREAVTASPQLRAGQFVSLMRIVAILGLLLGAVQLVLILTGDRDLVNLVALTLALALVAHVASLLARAGRLTIGVYLWAAGLAGLMVLMVLVARGLMATVLMAMIVNVLVVALFLSLRHVRTAAVGGAIFLVLAVLADQMVVPWPRMDTTQGSSGSSVFVYLAGFAVTAYLINLLGGTLLDALTASREYAGQLEQNRTDLMERTTDLERAAADLTQRGVELEQLNRNLLVTSQQASRRAARLEASAQVMRAASQVRDLDQLLPEVTRLISQAFGYYHVGIFLVDEAAKYAVLQAANSEGGQRMLARAHKLAVGTQGIVGRVTGSGKPHIALDVASDAVHRVNPDLPDTRSEMALPLRVGGRTLGALDVQSTEDNAFAQEDIATLGTMADQIAVAIENVRLLAQTQAALREAEEAQSRFLRQEWEQLLPVLPSATHEHRLSGVPRVGDVALPEIEQALQQNDVVAVQGGATAPGVRSALAVPIRLRDQVIGVIDLHETDVDRAWTEDDVALVTAVADQAAQALENARLFEQTQQRAHREQLVTQIATRVRAAQDVESILRAGVHEIRRVLGASHGVVRLNTEAPAQKLGEVRPAPADGPATGSEAVVR